MQETSAREVTHDDLRLRRHAPGDRPAGRLPIRMPQRTHGRHETARDQDANSGPATYWSADRRATTKGRAADRCERRSKDNGMAAHPLRTHHARCRHRVRRMRKMSRAVDRSRLECGPRVLVIVQREECTIRSRAVARILNSCVHFCVQPGTTAQDWALSPRTPSPGLRPRGTDSASCNTTALRPSRDRHPRHRRACPVAPRYLPTPAPRRASGSSS